jgi:hypothetical protein
VARILVVGDSLTYGQGVDAAWTYPAQLERLLARSHRVEVINLGVTGAQSEDVARVLRNNVPILRPDIIVYGMFLNDFLPSGPAQDRSVWRWLIPDWIRDPVFQRTRLAWEIYDAWTAALIRLGYTPDLWDDVLRDIDAYRRRFIHDLRDMQKTAHSVGLDTVIAMVFDYLPDNTGRGRLLNEYAASAMQEAGVAVIPDDGIYSGLHERPRMVSRWEFHPNAMVYAAFADRITAYLRGRPELRPYQLAPAQ